MVVGFPLAIQSINKNVLGLPQIKIILKDTGQQTFYLTDLFKVISLLSQRLDSLMGIMRNQKTYMGPLSPANGATHAIGVSQQRCYQFLQTVELTDALVAAGENFQRRCWYRVRYAGLPFVRAVVASSTAD